MLIIRKVCMRALYLFFRMDSGNDAGLNSIHARLWLSHSSHSFPVSFIFSGLMPLFPKNIITPSLPVTRVVLISLDTVLAIFSNTLNGAGFHPFSQTRLVAASLISFIGMMCMWVCATSNPEIKIPAFLHLVIRLTILASSLTDLVRFSF